MKIRTKLLLGTAIPVITAIIVATTLFFEELSDREVTSHSRIAEHLVNDIFEMNVLIQEYRSGKETTRVRIITQWRLNYKSMTGSLGRLSVDSPHEKAIIDDILDNLNGIDVLFDDLTRNIYNAESKERIFTQILSRSLTATSLARQYYEMNYDTLKDIHGTALLTVIISLAALIFSISILYILIHRSLSRPLAVIDKGLNIIGGGEFNHKIETMGNDEFRVIADSINLMGERLSKITVSKDLLFEEIAIRVKAQNELLMINERFKRLSEAATEGIVVTEDGRFIDTNIQFASMTGYTIEEIIGMKAIEFVVPDERNRLAEIMLSDYEIPYEITGLKKDGTTIDALICGKSLKLEGKNIRIASILDISELKRKEKELRMARDEWEETFNAIPDYIMLCDNEQMVVKINKSLLDRLQMSRTEAVGRRCFEVVHRGDRPPLGCPCFKTASDGMEHTGEVYDEQLKGYFLVTTTPHIDSNGFINGVIHIMRDITELKDAERKLIDKNSELNNINLELNEAKERFELLSEAASEGIAISEYGRLIDVNNQYAAIFGYTREEIIGRYAMELVVPNERERLTQIISSGYEEPFELDCIKKEGTIINVRACGKMLTTNSPQRITSISDITEYKMKESRLQLAKDEWEKTFNALPDYIMLLDDTQRIVNINESMIKGLDVKKEDVINKRCFEIVHSTDRPIDHCPCIKTLADGLEHTEEVYEKLLDSHFLVTTTPQYDQSGKIIGVIHLMRDITKLKRIEEELLTKNTVLDALNKGLERIIEEKVTELRKNEQLLIQQSKMAAMGEMIAAIAHQWRQPLNAISLFVQDIREAFRFGELDAAYIEESTKKTMQQIDFMSQTITEFRNFFKPSKEKERFDLIAIAAEVFSMFSHQLKVNSINYYITCHAHNKRFNHFSEVEPCDATTIVNYKSYIAHVILNLISNSKDAIMEGKKAGRIKEGIIGIDVYSYDEYLKLMIRDNGGGIPDNVMGRIFDPYFTTKTDSGTGIGLYMSKMIIEDTMNGSISVRNTEDGAVFTITLNRG